MIKIKPTCPYKVDYFNYYRSETPFDLNNMPEPIETIASDTIIYEDHNVEQNKSYYVAIGSVKNGVEKISRISLVTVNYISSYRWLLIYITDNNGSNYTSMQEIEITKVVGGVDITTTSTPTSESSYFSGASGANNASRLVDNNFTSFEINVWVSGTGSTFPHWVAFDLLTITDLAEVKIWPQNYADDGINRAPKSFVVRGSNDSVNWTDIRSFTSITGWVLGTPKTFNLITGVVT